MRSNGEETVSHEGIYQDIMPTTAEIFMPTTRIGVEDTEPCQHEERPPGEAVLQLGSRSCAPMLMKKRRKRLGRKNRRGRIQNRVSIEERPPVVEKRFSTSGFDGDWEVDLVAGANHEGWQNRSLAVYAIVERKCGHLLKMHPLGILAKCKKADEVTTAIIVELWPFVGKMQPDSARWTTLPCDWQRIDLRS